MKAKIVNEALSDVLQPKNKEDIKKYFEDIYWPEDLINQGIASGYIPAIEKGLKNLKKSKRNPPFFDDINLLIRAIDKQSLVSTKYFLEKINIKGEDWPSGKPNPLSYAISQNVSLDIIKLLLDENFIPTHHNISDAVSGRHYELAKILIEKIL